MPEIPVRIPVEDGRINFEAMYRGGTNGRNVVICHPHPLFGGDMDNNVVTAAQHAFAARGWGTLRYNFRGVGSSGGRLGQGEKEASDLIEICNYLREQHPGAIDLAGYSYGTWTVLRALSLGLSAESLCLLSPPLDFMSFNGLLLPPLPVLITLGNKDGFCSEESLRDWLAKQPDARDKVSLEIILNCDHFYWDFTRELSKKIENFLSGILPENAG